MATSQVGSWAADKLERWQKYLHAYTTIMRGQKRCDGFCYIDAFAGPREHEIRSDGPKSLLATQALIGVTNFGQEPPKQQEFLVGSPRAALDLEQPFSGYVFIEKHPQRVADVERLQAEYGNVGAF